MQMADFHFFSPTDTLAYIQAINKEEIENIHAISTGHAKTISQVRVELFNVDFI